jgi:hypothetical protein
VSGSTTRRALSFLAFALAVLVASPARAHKPSDSYLTLSVTGTRVDVRWDIALRDLDNVLALDRDASGAVTWGELRARSQDVTTLARDRLTIRSGDAVCPLAAGGMLVADHSDGAYAVLGMRADCPEEPRVLDVDYQLFFDVDPLHHGIARIDDGAGTRTAIFTSTDRRQRFERSSLGRAHQLASATKLGVAHIFSGIDHLLFLVALLLPSVLVRRGDRHAGHLWVPVGTLRSALMDVLKIVTAFTVAHSITLSLSAVGVLLLPSRFVESGIAASVVLAAVNNVVPILEEDRWTAAFALGLLHGFGFSATLMDLGLPRQNLVVTLFGFNLGVEFGQMCVVAAFLPLAYLARRTVAYRRVALLGGSVAIAGVATVWFVERAFAIKIF